MKGNACHNPCPGHRDAMCHLKRGHKGRHYANLRGYGRPRARWNTGDKEVEIVSGRLDTPHKEEEVTNQRQVANVERIKKIGAMLEAIVAAMKGNEIEPGLYTVILQRPDGAPPEKVTVQVDAGGEWHEFIQI